jgi:hypothetical protein
MEECGHKTLGLIFSRDGYARAFSHDMDFELSVTGSGMEKLEKNLYRLRETS